MLGDYFFDQSVTEEVGIYLCAKRESCPFSRAGRFIFYPVSDPLFALKTVERSRAPSILANIDWRVSGN